MSTAAKHMLKQVIVNKKQFKMECIFTLSDRFGISSEIAIVVERIRVTGRRKYLYSVYI